MVREARFQDIPRLCELMVEAHGKSKFRDDRLDLKRFKDLCKESLISGNGCLFVSEIYLVEGFVMGVLDEHYLGVIKAQYATDIFFIVSERDNTNAPALWQMFLDWGLENAPSVHSGATNAIADYRRTAKLYERKGMTQIGVTYELERIQ